MFIPNSPSLLYFKKQLRTSPAMQLNASTGVSGLMRGLTTVLKVQPGAFVIKDKDIRRTRIEHAQGPCGGALLLCICVCMCVLCVMLPGWRR